MLKEYICASRTQAVATIIDNLNYQEAQEMVPLAESLSRITATDIYSNNTMPNTVNSRWDCIVFRYDQWLKDQKDTSNWQLGLDYAYANTGVGIEGDYDTGLKVEETTFGSQNSLHFLREPQQKGDNTQPVGEWVQQGQLLIPAYSKILPAHLNILGSAGVLEVPVLKKPRIGFIATGNELVAVGQTPPPGYNIETNSLSIAAKCQLWGAEFVPLPMVPDQKDAIATAIKEATKVCDITIIGGGTARGTCDHTLDLLDELGHCFFHEVGHGPGKRTSFTVVDAKPVIGLVGPPMGEEMTFDFYVLPALAHCLQQSFSTEVVSCILDEDIPGHPKVDFYAPLHIYKQADGYHAVQAQSIPGPGALILTHINGYHFLPYGCGTRLKGQTITVELGHSVPVVEGDTVCRK